MTNNEIWEIIENHVDYNFRATNTKQKNNHE